MRPRFAIAVFVFLVAFLVFLLMPAHLIGGGSKTAAKRSVCLSNVKQLITSSLVYASDTDDRFPLKDSWNDTTREFRNPAYTIRCPLLPETDFGYAFNAALSGTKPPKMPEKVPLNFESTRPGSNPSDTFTSLPRPGRHDGKNSIGYADGHAKSVGF